MKLLYVVHQFFPDCHSGTEQYTLACAREARRRGDDVTILSLEPIFDRDDQPFVTFELPYDGFRQIRLRHWHALQPNDVLRDYENPLVARRFDQLLAELGPDVVHFFHLRLLGSDLIDVAADRGVRTVVNLMDFWYLCPRFTLQRADGTLCDGPPDGGLGCVTCAHEELAPLVPDDATRDLARHAALRARGVEIAAGTPGARLAALLRRPHVQLERLARADVAVAPSRFLADTFRANGYAGDNLVVVGYGLEPERVRRIEVDRPRAPLRVGWIGVFSPWKGANVVVDAVRAIPDATLTVTFHGRLDEPMFADYVADVRTTAADDPRLEFPGPFDHGELDEVLANLDVLVVPSLWYENTPFVVLEAFAAGVPVLASDLGGISEVVVPDVNGWLFPAGDAAALAALLAGLVADPDRIRGLDPRPLGTIADNYDTFASLYRGG